MPDNSKRNKFNYCGQISDFKEKYQYYNFFVEEYVEQDDVILPKMVDLFDDKCDTYVNDNSLFYVEYDESKKYVNKKNVSYKDFLRNNIIN